MMPATTEATIRVLVVDDHPLFRQGVASAFETDAAIEVVGMAGTAHEVLGEVRRLDPDVVLVDLNLGDGSGVDVCAEVQGAAPRARLLVVTRTTADRYVLKAFACGAHGYVVKTTDPLEIVRAVRAVANDQTYIDPTVAEHVVRLVLKGRGRPLPFGLTRQEMAVLDHIEGTFDLARIGEQLDMTVATVETHLAHAMRKLGVDDPNRAGEILRRQRDL